ncbi:MipA/OmpV family protein [Chimaeribacter californicus]|uniref:MipA/OmpV family protein n=1 Tax=Chimaeribacter californicus TaxID=2060067 RepID=A0A2N5DZN0_9GAMM|nr:MipA/OmpV family protein [Chimaeribacter californicus]PLR33317.1 MipA/OmpV family protein [Chimaeribacter californicus]
MSFFTGKALPPLLMMAVISLPAMADEQPYTLSGMVGGGIGVKPAYLGARDDKTDFIPAVKLNYGPYFIGGVDTLTAVGWNFIDGEQWKFALGVGSDLSPRQASDDEHLKGLGDIDVTPRAFLSGIYENTLFKGGVIATQDVGGNHQGLRVITFAQLKWEPTETLSLFAGPTLSWGNSQYLQTQFGVTSEQSARSGLPRYRAGSGLEDVGINTGLDYQFAPSWVAGVRASALYLTSDAADSPITEQSSQIRYGLFVAWRF